MVVQLRMQCFRDSLITPQCTGDPRETVPLVLSGTCLSTLLIRKATGGVTSIVPLAALMCPQREGHISLYHRRHSCSETLHGRHLS